MSVRNKKISLKKETCTSTSIEFEILNSDMSKKRKFTKCY